MFSASSASLTSNPGNDKNMDDNFDGESEPSCCTCGGEGFIEYNDGGPEVWGEDCPSEENHLVTCPNCRGSGLLKDCTSM
jgi:hypothetical protein